MKIIVAPDSFKGCMSARQAALAMERGIIKAVRELDSTVELIKVPMADGGEGTVEAIIEAVGGEIFTEKVLDPLGREITSFYGILPDNTAVIEMAAASGLNLINLSERNPLITTTYGTGQLIKAALEKGCLKLIIGIGGSATNDGGAGMAQALGARLTDCNNLEIGFGGGELAKIVNIDLSSLQSRAKIAQFIVASDVKNVLCGPEGASAVYGPQKGASPEMVAILDNNLGHLAMIIKKELGKDLLNIPGAGAAGGLGAGLMAFLDTEIRSGVDIIMEMTDFEAEIKKADLIITGEGTTDYQSVFGKVPFGIAQMAKKWNKPVLCISGGLGEGAEKLYDIGITALFSILDKPLTLDKAIQRGAELLERTTENIIRLIINQRIIRDY